MKTLALPFCVRLVLALLAALWLVADVKANTGGVQFLADLALVVVIVYVSHCKVKVDAHVVGRG